MDTHDTPAWAGIAVRTRDRTNPDRFILLTMQLVDCESTVMFEREFVDVGGLFTPRRHYLDTHRATVQVSGRLLARGDSWDQWRPAGYRGAAGELDGRRALPGPERRGLPT